MVVLLVAEARGWRAAAGVAKGVASSAFVAAALVAGATASTYGRVLLVAFAFSWLGDLLLLSSESKTFLAGLGAFLLAHVAFAAAFLVWGVDWKAVAIAAPVLALVAILIGRWLLPHVSAAMRIPVIAYMTALCTMVTFAAGAAWSRPDARFLLPAAVAFFISDISVARGQFVSPGISNQVWGLPLYYAAQLAFAASASMVLAPAMILAPG
ncbi:MAG TPA: lysoplasmalogenase [Thermoanaerobaculia bacterium]|nr:lysoplasmalogenase [Thermoanaerobaculia bacterium]